MCLFFRGRVKKQDHEVRDRRADGDHDGAREAMAATKLTALIIGLGALSVIASPAHCEAEFYRGKTLQVNVGFGPGGGYDLWARTLARHIGAHIPGNPAVVVQNMPGAGSLTALSRLYNSAPRDGTVVAAVARAAVLGPLVGAVGARFNPRDLSWIGTPTIDTNLCIAKNTADVKTARDLFTKTLITGDTGPGSGTYLYPRGLKELAGLKFQPVTGFPSTADVFLAMERGEVDGVCEAMDSVMSRRPTWIADKKVSLLLQGGVEPDPALKDVPFVLDLARNDEERRAIAFLYAGEGIGRPYVAPPGLAADRLALLRAGFDATMRDPDFVKDANNQKFAPKPKDGTYLEVLVRKIYETPASVIDRVGPLLR
jgi:tripartite-type tricarboxylate transporter receptor subunit TctC